MRQNHETISSLRPLTSSAVADELDALRRQVAELSEAVAARDTFIAVAGHELRNPMTPILGQVELLLTAVRAGRATPEQLEKRLERVQQTIRHYLKRAVVLLDVSRLTTGKLQLEPEEFDLSALLCEVAEGFADAARHAGSVVEVTCPDGLCITSDRLAVEQVIDNLVSNAIKYGGRTRVLVELAQLGGTVRLDVRDHGPGVAAHDRARVFERFERAVGQGERRSGFGVGLWVVGQLVAALDGSISIHDAPGGGALFTVTLPLAPTRRHR